MKSLLKSNRTKRAQAKHAAFTLIELVIVVAVVAVLAGMLVPTLAHTQSDSRAFQCLNNHSQLGRAWLMYADDNNDKLATSLHGAIGGTQSTWASGWLDWSSSRDNTNVVYLTDPRYSILSPYFGGDARPFKCPADLYVSAVQRALGWKARVRSISQNLYLANGNVLSGPSDPSYYVQVTKLTALLNPKPIETWLSIDEHPDSMNDGGFFAPYATSWIDLPANYHDGGAGVAFADGHAETHRWQSSALKFSVTFSYQNNMPVPANDPDIRWLRSRTPRRPGMN